MWVNTHLLGSVELQSFWWGLVFEGRRISHILISAILWRDRVRLPMFPVLVNRIPIYPAVHVKTWKSFLALCSPSSLISCQSPRSIDSSFLCIWSHISPSLSIVCQHPHPSCHCSCLDHCSDLLMTSPSSVSPPFFSCNHSQSAHSKHESGPSPLLKRFP